MSLWPEDFSTCTLQEVFRRQTENRVWNKELRHKNSSLVNSRLAKEISQADYLENRKLASEEAAECKRRANILDSQLSRLAGTGPQLDQSC
jgi:hypothetical protein